MLPNLLTLSRVFSVPFIIACFYYDSFIAHAIATVLFIVACITDFFDGYLARQWKQVSAFGCFMDPVADKVMVSSVLLMLSGFNVVSGVHLIAAVIILTREIMVSGLREFMSEMQVRVPVTRYAKWKTAIQMFAVSCLLISAMFPEIKEIKHVGIVALWLAVLFTIFTGIRYLRLGILQIVKEKMNIHS